MLSTDHTSFGATGVYYLNQQLVFSMQEPKAKNDLFILSYDYPAGYVWDTQRLLLCIID